MAIIVEIVGKSEQNEEIYRQITEKEYEKYEELENEILLISRNL